jgi:6-phosphogluconolactonase
MKYLKFLSAFLILFVIIFTGCQKNDIPTNVDPQDNNSILDKADWGFHGGVPVVITESNDASGNAIVVYSRLNDGNLTYTGSYPTGGMGSGDGLGSQGAVVLAGRYIFAVNAGSNDISVLKFQNNNVTMVDQQPSGGTRPISLTVHRNILYVLNAGGDENITGFKIHGNGNISQISGSTRPLSGTGVGPAQVEFSPNGRFLVVTEKMTNLIDTYMVNHQGIANGPNSQPSVGDTPFGFEFDLWGRLIVSDAYGGNAGAGAMSSYRVGYNGINLISGPVVNNQTAPCWVVVTNDGRFTYTTNTGTGNISGYKIHFNGSITLFNDGGNTGSTGEGSSPIDMALAGFSKYLYALGAGTHTISVFRINRFNGHLTSIQTITGLPDHAAGLAAN